MLLLRSSASLCLILAALAMIGCGGSSGCQISGITVMPPTATVNHAAAAPGNSQLFSAGFPEKGNCLSVGTLAVPRINWTASDPSVQLSSAANQVTATCTQALANPVTITATPVATTGLTFTGRASLTCN